MNKNASPVKLQSGAWGAKVATPAEVGDVVTIRTQGGKTWDAKITAFERVIDEGTMGQFYICQTVSLDRLNTAILPRRAPVVETLVMPAGVAPTLAGPDRAAIRSLNRRDSWRPCGYPGCSPAYCDECDGVGYRAGRGGRW